MYQFTNYWFDLCGSVILFTIIINFFSKYNIPVEENKCFRSLLICGFLCSLFNIPSSLWANYPDFMNNLFLPFVNEINNIIYFVARTAMEYYYLRYILITLDIHWSNIRNYLILLLPIILNFILIFTTPFTKAIFYINNNGIYQRGSFIILIYMVAVYYIVIGAYLILRYRKSIEKIRFRGLLSFIIISAISIVIQAMVPTMQVEGFGTSLCLLIIFFSVQKPEEMLDGQTGFLNKKIFIKMCNIKLHQKSNYTVVSFWINNYDLFEKKYGLDTIDILLKQICDNLKNHTKNTYYRILDSTIAIIIDDNINDNVATIVDILSNNYTVNEFTVTLPFYYTIFNIPDDTDNIIDLFDLIKIASLNTNEDQPLVDAKKLDIEKYKRKFLLDEYTKFAIERKMIRVVYQPIYEVKSNKFISSEALVRMTSPKGIAISPQDFIPVAEENGSIINIDHYVQDTVCAFFKENNLQNYGLKYIEVNLSIVECLQENLYDNIMKPLKKNDLLPSCINLEITETAVTSLHHELSEKLKKLSLEGISMSLDDYGTGYSNISRLIRIPFDIVKIDKILLNNILTSKTTQVILENTIRMLKQLNKKILIEGVETKEEADYVISLGCDYIQGFYYSKPLEANEFIEFIQQANK